jgi:hypothetical protein
MHIPVNITITCTQHNEQKVKDFLLPNKLIYVQDIYTRSTSIEDEVTIQVYGIVFDNQDVQLVKKSLMQFGKVVMEKGEVEILTLNTILSGLVVAVIVTLALIGHSFNTEFYKQVFEQHDMNIIFRTIFIIGMSAGAGFGLEILIIYRERRLSSHH